jgi:hypothetical protein
LAWALASVPVGAHDVPLERTLSVFVKVEPDNLHLLIRVPLDALRNVQFPVKANEIDLQTSRPAIDEALRAIGETIRISENGIEAPPSSGTARLSLPSDRSFADYDGAVAHVDAPIAPDTVIYSGQGFFDAHLEYRIGSPQSMFAIQSTLAPDLGDSLKLVVQYLPLEGTGRQCVITGRLGRVALNPTSHEAARRFFIRGIGHVPGAADHLLLLICLVVPFRSVRGLVPMVIALSAGHSATLIGTAFNLAQVGQVLAPVVDLAIALSIAYVALENITGATLDRRWLIAGVSGLVYGLGLSYTLRQELQFAGSHPLLSVLSFNLGIEIAQLVTLAVVFASVSHLLRGPIGERAGVVVISAMVAHTAWHWTIDRGTVLWQAGWPELDAPSLLILARWGAGVFVAISAARLIMKFRLARGFDIR